MPITALDERTALVLIDLQHGILNLPIVHERRALLDNARRLVDAFHEHRLPVFFLRVNNLYATRVDEPPPAMPRSPEFDRFTDDLQPAGEDVVITKHSWDAFYGTDLDVFLRRGRITQIAFAGIAASRGVESSARSAQVRGYNLAFAADAISDIHQASYDHSVRVIYPRIGQVDSTQAIVAALP